MNKNQETANKINNLTGLTEKAKLVIADTDINVFDEIFGNLNTAEEVNAFIEENYPDEV